MSGDEEDVVPKKNKKTKKKEVYNTNEDIYDDRKSVLTVLLRSTKMFTYTQPNDQGQEVDGITDEYNPGMYAHGKYVADHVIECQLMSHVLMKTENVMLQKAIELISLDINILEDQPIYVRIILEPLIAVINNISNRRYTTALINSQKATVFHNYGNAFKTGVWNWNAELFEDGAFDPRRSFLYNMNLTLNKSEARAIDRVLAKSIACNITKHIHEANIKMLKNLFYLSNHTSIIGYNQLALDIRATLANFVTFFQLDVDSDLDADAEQLADLINHADILNAMDAV